jgi:hypothetical protein
MKTGQTYIFFYRYDAKTQRLRDGTIERRTMQRRSDIIIRACPLRSYGVGLSAHTLHSPTGELQGTASIPHAGG